MLQPSSAPRASIRRMLLITLVLLAIGVVGSWSLSNARCFVVVGSTLCRVTTGRPLVAPTFDDGPTETGLRSLLPVLGRYDVKATFFLIGQEIERNPSLARLLVASGHEIGNHSYTHRRMVLKSSGFYDREIARTDALIRAVGGTPALFRPPYGKKLLGLPLAVRRHQRRMVTWDVEDPATNDPEAFARRVVDQARPGSIILLHAMYRSNETARDALPLILEGLRAKGLRPVTVSTLLREASARS